LGLLVAMIYSFKDVSGFEGVRPLIVKLTKLVSPALAESPWPWPSDATKTCDLPCALSNIATLCTLLIAASRARRSMP
jgi:hypothetical protein